MLGADCARCHRFPGESPYSRLLSQLKAERLYPVDETPLPAPNRSQGPDSILVARSEPRPILTLANLSKRCQRQAPAEFIEVDLRRSCGECGWAPVRGAL